MNPSSADWKSDPERRKRIEGDLNLRDTKKRIKELKKMQRTETVADVFDNMPTAIKKLNVETSAWSKCDKCNKTMVIKEGRRGEFLACSGFPKCKNAKPLTLLDSV